MADSAIDKHRGYTERGLVHDPDVSPARDHRRMALLIALATSIGAALGASITYLIKRRVERHRERDAIAIEQNKVKLLADVAGLLTKFEPSVQERTGPMLADLLETSLRNLSEQKQLPAAKAAPPPLLAARSTSRSEEEERNRREEAQRSEKAHRERMDKLHEEMRQSAEQDKQFWIELYRKPLVVVTERLMIYSFQSAERNVEKHDLIAFNKDRATFESAELQWRRALDESDKDKIDKVRKGFVEAFGILEKRLQDVLATVATKQIVAAKEEEVIGPEQPSSASPPASDQE